MADAVRSGPGRVIRGLALACHSGPTVAVTALTTALAVGAGNTAAHSGLVGLAVLVGQLSIGWSNDWIDAARDLAVARTDKPTAVGAIAAGQVRVAAFAALVLAVPLSLALGWRAGLVNLVVIAAGWAYNLGLKGSGWSWLPYAVAFGLIPAMATLPLPGHPMPPGWALGAGALLGVGAHLANVLPDLEDDQATGVRGFPHRLGRTRTALLAPLGLLGATLLVALGPAGPATLLGWTGLAAAVMLAVAAALVALRVSRSRLPFLLTIAVALVDVVLLTAAGSQLR